MLAWVSGQFWRSERSHLIGATGCPGNVLADNRGGAGVSIPNMAAGVYEVRSFNGNAEERIGETGDLRLSVHQDLIEGKPPHLGCKRIREPTRSYR